MRKPVSPAPADPLRQRMLQLQRVAGNRAVRRALVRPASPIGPDGGEASDGLQRQVEAARGHGQPLDHQAGAQMSRVMGADLSGVHIHTDARADMINRALSAQAATLGNDIFFSKGAYSPGTAWGRQLLAHELTHVAQQGGAVPRGKLQVGPADDLHEREAESVSASATASRRATVNASTNGPAVQRMMSYKTFGKKVAKRVDSDLVPSGGQQGKDESYFAGEVDAAFQRYEAAPDDLGNLARLHHAITAWQTFNFAHLNAGRKERKDPAVANTLAMNRILKQLLKEIKAEFKKRSAKQATKQGGYVQTLDEMLGESPDSMTFEDLGDVAMPKEFSIAGLSPTYYEKNLKGKPAEAALKSACLALERGDLNAAIEAMNHKALLALEGYPLIRSLILSHYSKSTQLKSLLNVKPAKGGLTNEEVDALQIYTSNSDPANSAMRGAANLSGQNVDAAMQYRLVVSALSKLPRFKGIAYRGITPFAGVDKAYQVGATVADLAFTSAAGSFAGVDHYLKHAPQGNATGTQNYFSIIRSKSAVHVSDKALSSRENEVLFKPGTRFRVKAVWRHSADGKVPMNAPNEAQMILHRVGKATAVYKDAGYGRQDWDALRERLKNQKKPDIGEFQGQAPVKVFEVAEQ